MSERSEHVDGAARSACTFRSIAFIAFTQRGCELAAQLAAAAGAAGELGCPQVDVSAPARFADAPDDGAWEQNGAWEHGGLHEHDGLRDASFGDSSHADCAHGQRTGRGTNRLTMRPAQQPAAVHVNPSGSTACSSHQRAPIAPYESLDSWAHDAFARADALVFVSAAGIAVRSIAPYLCDKLADPAVVSVDERGLFAVPLLSGHVGGANALAHFIAGQTGGHAVVSTATDVNGLFAVDEWARSQGLAIAERALAKEVSAHLLAGGSVGCASTFEIAGTPPEGVAMDASGNEAQLGFAIGCDAEWMPFERTLHLLPRAVTVGVGCRRGTEAAVLRSAVERVLGMARIHPRCVQALASIDVKRDEPAIAQLAGELGCETRFYSAVQLRAVPGEFGESAFVEAQVGVGNVCERAAVAHGGNLIVSKQAGHGVTVALALQEPQLSWPAADEN